MKEGRTLGALAEELVRQHHAKRDFVVPINAMRIERDWGRAGGPLSLEFKTDRTEMFGINDNAHQQIGAHLNIPRAYYSRLLSDAPELLRTNVNHWFAHSDSKRMLRTLDGSARAYLSSKYRPLDNYDLAEIALPEIEKAGCAIQSCDITDTKLYLKATSPIVTHTVPKVGDVVQAGVVISNSEIGAGTLQVSPLVYTLKCKNGLIVPDNRFKKVHVGRGYDADDLAREFFRDETRLADDRALWLKVRDVIAGAFSQIEFSAIVEKMGNAVDDKIEGDPVKAIEVTQKMFSLSQPESNGILVHLLQGNDLSRYGLLNAATRASQDVTDYDRATDLERLGGQILELPKTDWQRIATAH